MDQSGNPAFTSKLVKNLEYTGTSAMTRGGTYAKTAFLLLLVIGSGLLAARYVTTSNFSNVPWWLLFATSLGALVLGIIISFNPKKAPLLSPVYAIAQGALLGLTSAAFASQYDGVVGQAIVATVGAFCAVYLGYATGVLRATPKFAKIIITAIVGTLFISLGSWLISLFSHATPIYLSSSNWGIGFSLIVVAVAALSLVLDFDFIERASEERLPKYFEWYGAFGLMVGLIWLYLELLRLFSKIAARQ